MEVIVQEFDRMEVVPPPPKKPRRPGKPSLEDSDDNWGDDGWKRGVLQPWYNPPFPGFQLRELVMVRRLALGVLVLSVVGFMGAKSFVSQIQSQVSDGLKAVLTLKAVPSNVIGGPLVYEITQETIDGLIAAKKAGKKIVVGGAGGVSLK